MDLNYVLKREQISLVHARTASCGPSRAAHAGLARGYARLARTGHYAFKAAPLRMGRND